MIKKIEGLKTDSASRPYADVRVMDCGQLITKSANDGKSANDLFYLKGYRYFMLVIKKLVLWGKNPAFYHGGISSMTLWIPKQYLLQYGICSR